MVRGFVRCLGFRSLSSGCGYGLALKVQGSWMEVLDSLRFGSNLGLRVSAPQLRRLHVPICYVLRGLKVYPYRNSFESFNHTLDAYTDP